jgi:hypothetical protein
MFKNFSLFTKYPYTAGVIACIWIGTAVLTKIDSSLPLVKMATINIFVTTLVAAVGFNGKN